MKATRPPHQPPRGRPPRRPAAGLPRGERGSFTLLAAILALAMLAMIGLVVDGTARLRAVQHADAVAEQAARAGASSLNILTVQAGGPLATDPAAALTAARSYLQAAGYPNNTITLTDPVTVTVRIRARRRTVFLSLLGLTSYTVTGQGTATLARSGP